MREGEGREIRGGAFLPRRVVSSRNETTYTNVWRMGDTRGARAYLGRWGRGGGGFAPETGPAQGFEGSAAAGRRETGPKTAPRATRRTPRARARHGCGDGARRAGRSALCRWSRARSAAAARGPGARRLFGGGSRGRGRAAPPRQRPPLRVRHAEARRARGGAARGMRRCVRSTYLCVRAGGRVCRERSSRARRGGRGGGGERGERRERVCGAPQVSGGRHMQMLSVTAVCPAHFF